MFVSEFNGVCEIWLLVLNIELSFKPLSKTEFQQSAERVGGLQIYINTHLPLNWQLSRFS